MFLSLETIVSLTRPGTLLGQVLCNSFLNPQVLAECLIQDVADVK